MGTYLVTKFSCQGQQYLRVINWEY